MKKIHFVVAAGLGLVQLALSGAAAQAQDTSRVLNNVVVTATRSAKKLSEIGRDVVIISADQINRSQGKSLPEILNSVPGITFSGANNAPGIGTSVYLRGASTGNTLILVDGFPVNNASAIDNSYDLNAFPVDQIDHIEILKGSGSTLYGSDAVAGVINIITKHAKGQGIKAAFQISGGSYNTFNESAGINGNISNTGIALNLSHSDSHGFPAATDTTGKGNFRNDDFHQRSASLNLSQKISSNFSLTGNLQLTSNTGHLPYGAFADDPNFAYTNNFLFAGLGARLQLKKGDLRVNISQNSVQNNFTDQPSAINFDTYSFQKNSGHITDAEAIFDYSLGKYVDLTSGVDFKYSGTHQLSTYDTIRPVSSSIASVYSSLFFRNGIEHLELGGRYNHDNRYGSNFTFTANESVILANQFMLFSTVSSAFKAPSLYQLTSPYSNPFLKPETTLSYEGGFNWEIISNILSLNADVFQRDTKDVIYFKSLANAPYGIYENGSKENDRGYESSVGLKLTRFSATAYIAHVTGSLTDASGLKSDILYRRPKNTLGANINYQLNKDFALGFNYKYTGDRVDKGFNPVTFEAFDTTLKSYNIVDAHLQCQATKKLTIFADLKNIFNEKYTEWLGYNTRGRNFMAGLKYQIN